MLDQCLAAVEQAQQKIAIVRKWRPRLEKAAELYRSGVSRLGKTIDDDIPRAVALLDRLAITLEQYLQIEAPAGSMAESAAPAALEESMSRGGEAGMVPPPKADIAAPAPTAATPAATAPASPSETPAPSEGRDGIK